MSVRGTTEKNKATCAQVNLHLIHLLGPGAVLTCLAPRVRSEKRDHYYTKWKVKKEKKTKTLYHAQNRFVPCSSSSRKLSDGPTFSVTVL